MLNPKKAMQKIWSKLFSGRSLSTEQIMLATMVVEKPPPPLSQAVPPMEPVTAAEAYRQLEHPTCICTTAAFETVIDPNIGHVRSVEMSLLKKLDIDQATIDLLELGPSHRMAEPPDTFRRQYRLVWTHVKVALSKLAAITTESDRVKDWQRINVAVDNWANKVDTQLSHHYEAAENHGHTHLEEAIVRIQKHFVLTISDKAPKNFTIVCKYHLDRMAYTRLASSSEIRPIPDDCQNYDETLEATKHITFAALDSREWVHAKLENTSLPTYMLLPKMIKILKCTEAGESSKHYRNVTQTHKASSCTLAELINLISRAINTAYTEMCEEISKALFEGDGILARYYFRTDTAVTIIHAWHTEHIECMGSWDYGRMFETVPKTGLIEAKTNKLARVLEHRNMRYLLVNMKTGKHSWSRRKRYYRPNSRSFCVNVATYSDIIDKHLSIAVIKHGKTIYRQEQGVGMGTKCSKEDAEDYIDDVDYRRTKTLVDSKRYDDLKQFLLFYRVADDMCGANGDRLDSLLREFEPIDSTGQPVLELKKVNETDDEIVFCDARLKKDNSGELGWQLYDKAEDMGSMASKLNRYNHAHTTLASSIHKATFRNELNRFYTLSKTLPHFLHSAGVMICRHIILKHTTPTSTNGAKTSDHHDMYTSSGSRMRQQRGSSRQWSAGSMEHKMQHKNTLTGSRSDEILAVSDEAMHHALRITPC